MHWAIISALKQRVRAKVGKNKLGHMIRSLHSSLINGVLKHESYSQCCYSITWTVPVCLFANEVFLAKRVDDKVAFIELFQVEEKYA